MEKPMLNLENCEWRAYDNPFRCAELTVSCMQIDVESGEYWMFQDYYARRDDGGYAVSCDHNGITIVFKDVDGFDAESGEKILGSEKTAEVIAKLIVCYDCEWDGRNWEYFLTNEGENEDAIIAELVKIVKGIVEYHYGENGELDNEYMEDDDEY